MQQGCSLRVEAFPFKYGDHRLSQRPAVPLVRLPAFQSSHRQALTGGTFVAEPGVRGSSSLGGDGPLDSMSLPGRQWVGLLRECPKAAWEGQEATRVLWP